jgi:hypothetical protein
MVEMCEFLVRVVRSYVGLLDAPLLRSEPRTSRLRSTRRRKHSRAVESAKAGFVARIMLVEKTDGERKTRQDVQNRRAVRVTWTLAGIDKRLCACRLAREEGFPIGSYP